MISSQYQSCNILCWKYNNVGWNNVRSFRGVRLHCTTKLCNINRYSLADSQFSMHKEESNIAVNYVEIEYVTSYKLSKKWYVLLHLKISQDISFSLAVWLSIAQRARPCEILRYVPLEISAYLLCPKLASLKLRPCIVVNDTRVW